ncbi:hypothetical protein [uncultured Cohaesibacter sp.]|uniref:hypothetical protein n=1 Tax=uncultured Cohaesibacter sp. TaxID=1002546 RepID=UPI0029C90C34|nr:hypothetical protein [uncultured Cohaesibacter sp.]
MGDCLRIVAAVLLWLLVLFYVIGVPLLVLLLPEPLVRAPEWLSGALHAAGYGLLALWLIGTELYLRWEDARHG